MKGCYACNRANDVVRDAISTSTAPTNLIQVEYAKRMYEGELFDMKETLSYENVISDLAV